MTNNEPEVTIRLDRGQALALFEWAHRFAERKNVQLTHPADAIAVDSLASALEEVLPEVFTEEYPQRLASSRERVVEDYRSSMEPQHCRWFEELEYQDVD